MSVVNLLEEELEPILKKMGLSINDIEKYETEGKNLLVYIKGVSQPLKIKSPYLVDLAKAKIEKERIADILAREKLLARLYLLESLVDREREVKDFLKEYNSFTSRELLQRIIELEENVQDYLPKLKGYATIKIISTLIKKRLHYISGMDMILNAKTLQELAEIHLKLSSGEFSVEDLFTLEREKEE